MRRRQKLGTLTIVSLALGLAFGCAEPLSSGEEEVPFPSELADEASAFAAEKRVVLERLAARRPRVRELLAGQVVGESDDGYLAIPSPSPVEADAEELGLMAEDNADRAALYEIIIRGTVLESLQTQADGITAQVVDQVCPQLDEQGRVCDLLDLENRVAVALDSALMGEPIASDDWVGGIVKAIVEPLVEVTVETVSAVELPRIERAFGREYQEHAPSGSWIETDGQWSRVE